jgi:CubicO group peptidase (beta-lactamase class C family)
MESGMNAPNVSEKHAHFKKPWYANLIILGLLSPFSACVDSDPDATRTFQPIDLGDGIEVSTAEEEGIESQKLRDVYESAAKLENIYSLLIAKNDRLVGEKYFHGEGLHDANPTASVTKSITSALTGIAMRERFISSLDKKMLEFFPEIDRERLDPRKAEVTLRQMLQMRSGYPWEESEGYLDKLFSRGNWISLLEEFPLTSTPGSRFGYSNLIAHTMGIIVARSARNSLLTFSRTYLFDPMNVQVSTWPRDSLGYCFGNGDLWLKPRDMIKFGQLYLNNGLYKGARLIPADWMTESLQPYSFNVYGREILNYVRQLDYGYYWWSGTSGSHRYNFAWGHGGQLIVVLRELNIVIVTTAYSQIGFDNAGWQKEKAIIDLVGRFISTL